MKPKFLSLAFLFLWTTAVAGQEYQNGVVVSVSAPGSDVGLSVLKQGGNAVDAAVATAFALAVTHPQAGNIGGGGFMLIYSPKGEPVVIDYRETAPAAATKTMFKKGDSRFGCRVVGVPCTVRGLGLAHQKFGKLPWKTLVLPAVELAEKGFVLDNFHANSLNKIIAESKDWLEMQRVFGHPEKQKWRAGDRLVQPDLAKTLRLIAHEGPDAFYKGRIADEIVAEMKAGNGLITKEDLQNYQAILRKPIHTTYRGYDIYGPPPPSSGGVALCQMLNTLENFDLRAKGRASPDALHLIIEAMRRAYVDRARYLGDPTFVKIPDFLTSKEYAKKLAHSIDLKKATPSAELAIDIALGDEGDSTTHFSVIDKDSLAVANTYTLEHSYGSKVVVKGAGFLLNNEMMDFNWRPGITTKTGVIGTDPNLIAPGKRMLSSQTPAVVAKDGKLLLVTGSPGGRTIINTVLQVIVNVVDYELSVEEAVQAPRLHHQWFPDEVKLEDAKKHPQTVEALRALGHKVIPQAKQGDAHTIWINPRTGGYVGAADRRLSGKVAGY
ncbi:MAG: gamma-glutamyltransferase [Gemmataceae bacterium]|nr:gamma-glutamyltransferase [Gemmataceae bacterium]MCI0738244.1 gamma-glutamyltransferase [Gemmataceae bacterium]